MAIELKAMSAAQVCRWLAGLLCVVLLVMLIMTAVRSPQAPPRLTASGESRAHALSWRWFGNNPGATVATTAENRETLDEANIDGTLHGVVILGERAYATLRMTGREERVYRVGDEIQSGIEIVAVEPGRVIVSQNGRELQITLPEEGRYLRAARQSADVGLAETGNQVSVAGFSATQVAVEGYDGGLQLDQVPDDVGNLGVLQNGDVIVEVDGVDIPTLLSDPTRWTQFSSNTTLPVTVMRDGETITVSVNAQGLAARLLPALGGQQPQ